METENKCLCVYVHTSPSGKSKQVTKFVKEN